MLASSNPQGQVAQLRFRDVDSGEEYDAFGRALSGGDALLPLAGYNQFWFAWSVFNHDSEIFGRSERVSTAAIQGGGECAVPCEQLRLGCPGPDCIPALTKPRMVSPSDGSADYLSANSYVVGVAVAGEARAYPHNILWWHEIINDVVGGVPIAVTHCPLTFSSLGHDPSAFVAGETAELGVSGRLYNSNLVFYNRRDDSYFSQLLGVGTKGAALGSTTPRVHVWEMSWAAWRSMYPGSTVLASDTGHARDYTRYPYGSYFTDDGDTFAPTDPAPDGSFGNKTITYGLRVGGAAKGYAHTELARWARATYGDDAAPVGVVNDTIGDATVALVFDIDAGYVQAFDRTGQPALELVP